MTEWKAYIVIALIASGGAALVYSWEPQQDEAAQSTCFGHRCDLEASGMLVPFWDSPVEPSNITVIANGARPSFIDERLGNCEVSPTHCATIEWNGEVGHVTSGGLQAFDMDPGILRNAPLIPVAGDGPEFGVDTWAVEGILYVFDGNGLLVASSDTRNITGYIDGEPFGESATNRFPKHPDYMELPQDTYYLGTGMTPEGMARLPMFEDEARSALMNAKVGSVISSHSDEFAWLFDRLYFTFKVTALPET